MARILKMGLKNGETFPVAGTSEDAAMLLAFEKGARLIVAVGTTLEPRGLPRQGARWNGEHVSRSDALRHSPCGRARCLAAPSEIGHWLGDGVPAIIRWFCLWAVVSQSALMQSFALNSWTWPAPTLEISSRLLNLTHDRSEHRT